MVLSSEELSKSLFDDSFLKMRIFYLLVSTFILSRIWTDRLNTRPVILSAEIAAKLSTTSYILHRRFGLQQLSSYFPCRHYSISISGLRMSRKQTIYQLRRCGEIISFEILWAILTSLSANSYDRFARFVSFANPVIFSTKRLKITLVTIFLWPRYRRTLFYKSILKM